MDDFEKELKTDFLQEASDLLERTEASFLDLEKSPENKTLLDSIFRFAHNLKGTSRAVGFGQIAELTHKAENVLLKLKEGSIPVTESVVSILLLFNDQVDTMISGLKEDLEATFEMQGLMESLDNIAEGKISETVTASPVESLEALVEEVKAPSFENFEEEVIEEQVMEEVPIAQKISVEPPPKRLEMAPEIPSIAPAPKPENKTPVKKEKEDETIRVSLGRLEKLSDSVGELVILQSVVERAMSGNPGDIKTARALSKLCKNIQDLSMSIRLVPVSSAFQKLQRTVRDTSKALGKKIDLRLIGEETEIDRTVLEHLGDPLVHLIRNAVDHGIEPPHDRLLAGKSEEGVVEVMAAHEGNYLVIQITDDGKGMSTEKLMKKAREKGILRADQKLSEQEALNLIFHPGFSTKEEVSEVSGRGVGMDVVKTNIEALGGQIRIQSKVDVGSCFRLMLPLTLAVIDGMLVSAGGQRVILSRGQVHEITRLDAKDIHMAGGKSPFYTLRNEVLPLFSLSKDMGSMIDKELIAVIVRSNQIAFAVAIEDVLRQQQVVVKPPTKELIGKPGMMGTTILGDGRPALIIDLIDMYSKIIKRDSLPKAA